MTTSLKNETPWTVDEVVTRRIQEHSSRTNKPGLGTLAAIDYMNKQHPAGRPTKAAKPGATRRELHIQEIQKERQALIAAGIIKPVVAEDSNAVSGTVSATGDNS